MSETKICETCKHEAKYPDEFPCDVCARSSNWESKQNGCEFCNNKSAMADEIGTLSISGNELIITDEHDNERFFIINHCLSCGRKLAAE